MATLILKATEKCNSNCYYCDVVRKEDTGKSMSPEVLEKVFERIDEYLMSYPEEQVEILWHGGEPLLLRPEYFRRALEFQDRHCGRTKSRIRHSMQTNLTCFTDEFVDIFRSLGITSVGTSYDPEPHMRGAGQKINSDKYNRQFIKALSVLERNGFGWGLIYVVTKRSLSRPLDVFHYLTNLKLTGAFNMNPVLIYDEDRKDVAITPDEYVEFLGAIFPVWWKYRHRYPDVEPFRALTETLLGGGHDNSCLDLGVCGHMRRAVAISPEGIALQPGRAVNGNDKYYGTIRSRTLFAILRDIGRERVREQMEQLNDPECLDCELLSLCRGGTSLRTYLRHKVFIRRDEWCKARRTFMSEYVERITGHRIH